MVWCGGGVCYLDLGSILVRKMGPKLDLHTHKHTQTHATWVPKWTSKPPADTHRHPQTHTDTHRHTHRHTQTRWCNLVRKMGVKMDLQIGSF